MILRVNIYWVVEAIESEKHWVHSTDSRISESVRGIRHYALNKRADSLFRILNCRPKGFDCFDQNAFIWSIYIRVIESRSIKKCHISHCTHLHTRRHSFVRLHTFENTWTFCAKVIDFWNNLRNSIQECWFTLTTFSKYTSCPFTLRYDILFLYLVSYNRNLRFEWGLFVFTLA